MKSGILRQGDVLLVPVAKLPAGAVQENVVNDVILAYGEVTGHTHRIQEHAQITAWSAAGERFIKASADVQLLHEEHQAAPIKAGVLHQQGFQVEERGEEVRRVRD